MDLREELLRRRNDNRFIFGGLLVLLLLLSGIFYLLQRGQSLPQTVVANRLLLFALWYVNIILILAILFVLVRSSLRILVDRQNRILGSRFQTKLVLAAIALSLIPVLILFPLATRLILDSFDQWFSLPIEEVVKQAAETAQGLSDEIERTNLRDARRALDELAGFDLGDLRQYPDLLERMQDLRVELQADYLAIYDGTEPVHGTADPRAGFRRDPTFRGLGRFLREAITRGEAIHVESSLDIEGRLILAAVARPRGAKEPPVANEPQDARDGEDGDGEPGSGNGGSQEPPSTVAVVGTVLPPDLAQKSEQLIQAYQRYLRQSVERDDIRASFLLILLMGTLLVVLAFSSISTRLARRVMAPIQALAEGTRRISSGDLDHRVEVAVDDELSVLVDAFNHMTAELKRNRELIDRSNQELLRANERLAAVLHNVAAGVLSIDPEGRVLTCNEAALRILHQAAQSVVDRRVTDAWRDEERGKLVELAERDLSPGRELTAQIRLLLDGVRKTLEIKMTALPGPAGEAGGRVMVLEDLTELLEAQKRAAWTEVARRIAHEIKNPLTPIKLTAERLLRKHRQGDPLGETLEKGAETIVREVETMKGMVDEFSRYARMPRPRPREIDLERFLAETVRLYQEIKLGVEVRAQVAADASSVRFDTEGLRSVLTNLLDNAVDSTSAPGIVEVRALRRDGCILLQVADTGIGVAPEDVSKLFQPYFSTKGRGTGLGLAIVQRIVTEHDAKIRVEDNTPQGTVFTVEIPVE